MSSDVIAQIDIPRRSRLLFLAERYYVTFGYCYRKSVCRLSVVCDVDAPYLDG